ncbi:hypothetical protein LCI18_002003 [Fusarium solani-melongenae]|uniref:Uncharacterized protein n=1 Tax=Fusarium solani subsp. cucurbitae TaxID=2747967 RepID=A0ACD3YT86_FUSSC|nr:hypothetical protein LCI18_002003 [Fusarium solani-melongenae]
MASGWRPDSYRSLYSADPVNTHALTFDYRPSIRGWRYHGCPSIAIALVNELAQRQPSVHFAGRAGRHSYLSRHSTTDDHIPHWWFIPVLSPVARIRPLFRFFSQRLTSKWDNFRRLGEFVKETEGYDITLLHAEDDTDIPIVDSIKLYREAVRVAENAKNVTVDEGALLERIERLKGNRGEGRSITVWPTRKGDIRLEILKYGVHDKIMSYPATGLAISRAFKSVR